MPCKNRLAQLERRLMPPRRPPEDDRTDILIHIVNGDSPGLYRFEKGSRRVPVEENRDEQKDAN